jgi:hypothetical protein
MPSLAAFNNIWNWNPGPSNTIPAGWSWPGGNGSDIVLQRMNLQSLFHRVVLVNGVGGQGYFSINSNSPTAVPLGGSGVNTYFLDGTVLNLYNTNQTVQAREVIRGDMSRVFEFGIWRDQISVGTVNPPPGSTGLASLVAMFFASGWVTNNCGTSPPDITEMMSAYMTAYTSYAYPCFNYSGNNNPWKQSGTLYPVDVISSLNAPNGKFQKCPLVQ